MKRPIWPVITLSVILSAGAVYWFQGTDPQHSQANLRVRSVPADSASQRALLCRAWQWVGTIDQYQGGTKMLPAKDAASQWLIFYEDGLYEQREADHRQAGIWRIDAEGAQLALVDGARATHEVIREGDYRHQIRRLTNDSLALAWQGRHGYVTEWYRAVPEAELDVSKGVTQSDAD